MIWHFINSGFNTGQFNMDFDIELADNCRDDEAFLRFYRWDPYCISLGANQSIEDVDIKLANKDGIDIVKRPTGGRAILHAEELTYSVVIPVSLGLSAKDIYKKISRALVEGLRLYNPRLYDIELEMSQPNFRYLLKDPSGKFCFASTAKSEVKFKNKKIVGSAQRKLNKVILQHGSILCGAFHRKLVNYIPVRNENSLSLSESTTEIESIIEDKVDYDLLVDKIKYGFELEWEIKFQHSTKLNPSPVDSYN